MLNRRPSGASRGFTLAEVVATTAIMAILAALTLPSIRGRLQTGEANAIVAEYQNLQTAISNYKNDVGRYPGDLTYLSQLPTPASSSVDGCGHALSTTQINNYHGPYVNRSIPSSGPGYYLLPSGDTVLTPYATVTLTNSTSIQLGIKGVDSTVAALVEVAFNGVNASGTCLTCLLSWSASGETTELVYHIPFGYAFGKTGFLSGAC
jgi:general secretion pathway protein G